MKKIILASTSPYRKALLERLMIDFDCIPPQVDEDKFKEMISDPYELAQTLGYEKANAIAKHHPDSVVIGSDQLAHCNGKRLSKPQNFDNALKQLNFLSGNLHELVTSVTIIKGKTQVSFTNITKLKMRNLTEGQIKRYLLKDQPFDCAGSYKLELSGIALFEEIKTEDQSAIIGLPLIQTATELLKLGVQIP